MSQYPDAMNLEALLNHLKSIREKHGDEAYTQAARSVAAQFLAQGGQMEVFAREAFKDVVDFDTLEAEKAQMPADNPILSAIRQQVPGIKTQAQFNVFMAAFDALRVTMDAIFQGNPSNETRGRDALMAALNTAHKVTEVTEKLKDIPEAAVSRAAAEFKDPPKQFTEVSEQKALLDELQGITSLADLNAWYVDKSDRISRVYSQSLRNALFDAIRDKKTSFSSGVQ